MRYIKTVITVLWFSILFEKQVHTYEDTSYTVKTYVDVWRRHVARVTLKGNKNLNCVKPESYVCEVPPNVISAESSKFCNYRGSRYQEQIYRWVAGWGCLLYTPTFLFINGANPLNMNTGCFYEDLFAPCLEIVKSDGTCGCYPFDPGLAEVLQAVKSTQVPAATERWEQCFYEADLCCTNHMGLISQLDDNVAHCEATFDGWSCWHNTEANSVATQVCSDFAYSNSRPSCHHYSSKTCFSNATWNVQTDYTTCSIAPRFLTRYQYHIGVLSFSIAACLPAVFVFFFYKRLRVTRVALHRNLLIVIVLRNAAVIVSRSVIYLDEITSSAETVMSMHSVACRVLAVVERVLANAVFVCMLTEGVYLHRLIVAVFKKQLKVQLLYGVGAVLTVVPVIAWAVVMGTLNDHSCWLVYTVDHVQWILDGPRMAILLINTFFFLDILRVLLTTKLRSVENSNQLNTTKATLFLMPLFGSQFLLTTFRPNTLDCVWEEIYYFFTYTVEGFQGFLVAMLYCYVNKEVHNLIRATYKKTESFVSQIGNPSHHRRTTTTNVNSKRLTYSNVSENRDSKIRTLDKYVHVMPKLHRAEILSIQTASERVAEIFDPIYETVTTSNHDYNDSLDSVTADVIDTDEVTKSVSMERQVSALSTRSDNSLSGYEIQCLERNFSYLDSDSQDSFKEIAVKKSQSVAAIRDNDYRDDFESIELNMVNDINDTEFNLVDNEILQQIMQDMKSNHPRSRRVVLDANNLSPNRKDGERIIFIED